MSRVSTWFHRLLVMLLLLLMQGPAMLMQELAWAKMLVEYTQERGLKRGLIETFDGKHPCELCAKASKLREDEPPKQPQNRDSRQQNIKLSWAKMIAASWLKIPRARELGAIAMGVEWTGVLTGRGMDCPALPPPEIDQVLS